jgi:hypothetical protein
MKLKSNRNNLNKNVHESVFWVVISCTLKLEVAGPPKRTYLLLHHMASHPEDHNLYNHHCENHNLTQIFTSTLITELVKSVEKNRYNENL